jgi:chromosome segregation ATPase
VSQLKRIQNEVKEVKELIEEKQKQKSDLEAAYLRSPSSIDPTRIISLERELELLNKKLRELEALEADVKERTTRGKRVLEEKLRRLKKEIEPRVKEFYGLVEKLQKLAQELEGRILEFENERAYYYEVCRDLGVNGETFDTRGWPSRAWLDELKKAIDFPKRVELLADLTAMNFGGGRKRVK